MNTSLKPLYFLLHRGAPHVAPLFDTGVHELRKRRIARIGDPIVCDTGYYSYRNNTQGIREFEMVPCIFPGRNFNRKKLMQNLSYPLSIFGRPDTDTTMKLFKNSGETVAGCTCHQDYFEVHQIADWGCIQINERCILFTEIPPLYNPFCQKGRWSEGTVIRSRHISWISFKEQLQRISGW